MEIKRGGDRGKFLLERPKAECKSVEDDKNLFFVEINGKQSNIQEWIQYIIQERHSRSYNYSAS